jgi:hypothetical protein
VRLIEIVGEACSASQRGQRSARTPRIPPYSVLQWSHRNMGALRIGRSLAALSLLVLFSYFSLVLRYSLMNFDEADSFAA